MLIPDSYTRLVSPLSEFDIGSVLYYIVALFGLSLTVWAIVGLVRFLVQSLGQLPYARALVSGLLPKRAATAPLTPRDVAVIMPAYNEELVIARSIAALLQLVPVENIFIISDGSTDNTASVARSLGVHVLDLPNQGKAGALQSGIQHYKLAERFTGVLFVDADTIVSPDYLQYALPYLEDPRVAVVAGFAKTLWEPQTAKFWNLFLLAYRDRAYRLFQYLLKYGQAWLPVSVTHIVPGFCSLYRASILPKIHINAPGLVIEDFNMTFEVHKHKLGKIIMDPRVCGNTQDPDTLPEYIKQIRRWHLGLWQTIRRHGFWPSLFSAVLLLYMSEVILAAVSLLLIPIALVFVGVVAVLGPETVSPALASAYAYLTGPFNIVLAIVVVFLIDYAISIVIAVLLRRPQYLWYGLGFGAMRFVDAWAFLITFPRAFLEHSTGAWVSPTRRAILNAEGRMQNAEL